MRGVKRPRDGGLLGVRAKAELKGLPEPGRRAFREALIACSLYADELARFMPMSMTAMLTGANAKEG